MDVKLPLACLLISGGALGLALPALSGPDRLDRVESSNPASNFQGAAGQQTSLAIARSDADEDKAAWANEVALKRERDGHFYADVSVDGRSINMLVDTGASVIALTGEDANALGLFWEESEVATVAQGANGPVKGVNVTLPRVSLGGFEASNVRALIVPEGLGISLLGQSFLASVNKVEIAGDRMVMSD